MSETVNQTPGTLHVKVFRGDAWSMVFNFNLDLSDWTILASVSVAGMNSPVSFAVAPVDLPEGVFTLSLSAAASASLPTGWHCWTLVMHPTVEPPFEPAKRTYLSGRFVVVECC